MANNPTLLAMPLAENGQKNTIPVTQAAAGDGLFSQSTGFPPETALPLGAGGVAPKREDFNGAFNVLSDIAFYAQKGWVFKWDAGQAYFKGCEVIDPADGLKYRCIQDVDAGGDAPSADEAVHWWPVIEGESIGSVKMCLATTIPDGWLSLENGQLVLRSAFPELWAWVQGNAPLITDEEWQIKAAAQRSVGYYSSGDGSTTFRLPRLLGFAEGVAAAPESVGMIWCVRAFGAATNQGTVDITALAQMLNLKLSIADAPAVCTPFGFPSGTYINVPVTNNITMNYTAPANGYVAARMLEESITGYIRVGVYQFFSYAFSTAAGLTAWIPVPKGRTVDITAQTGRHIAAVTFAYAQGEV